MTIRSAEKSHFGRNGGNTNNWSGFLQTSQLPHWPKGANPIALLAPVSHLFVFAPIYFHSFRGISA